LFEDYFPLLLIDHVTDDKEMVSVVLDFRPLGRIEDILQGEGMEIETVSEFSKKRNIVEPIHVYPIPHGWIESLDQILKGIDLRFKDLLAVILNERNHRRACLGRMRHQRCWWRAGRLVFKANHPCFGQRRHPSRPAPRGDVVSLEPASLFLQHFPGWLDRADLRPARNGQTRAEARQAAFPAR
jgi:hypothetical protein